MNLDQIRHLIVAHPVLLMTLNGVWTAVVLDLLQFLRFKTWDEFATFDWSVASFNWGKGALSGFLGAVGVNAVMAGADAVTATQLALMPFALVFLVGGRRAKRNALVVLLALGIGASGCAAQGARNQTRVAALTVGEAMLSVDQAERDLYRANAFDKATHDRAGAVVLKGLYAARAFERAALAWSEGETTSEKVAIARRMLLAVLDELDEVLPPGVTGGNAFTSAVQVVRSAVNAGGGQ